MSVLKIPYYHTYKHIEHHYDKYITSLHRSMYSVLIYLIRISVYEN